MRPQHCYAVISAERLLGGCYSCERNPMQRLWRPGHAGVRRLRRIRKRCGGTANIVARDSLDKDGSTHFEGGAEADRCCMHGWEICGSCVDENCVVSTALSILPKFDGLTSVLRPHYPLIIDTISQIIRGFSKLIHDALEIARRRASRGHGIHLSRGMRSVHIWCCDIACQLGKGNCVYKKPATTRSKAQDHYSRNSKPRQSFMHGASLQVTIYQRLEDLFVA
jgi:hypothetical protein